MARFEGGDGSAEFLEVGDGSPESPEYLEGYDGSPESPEYLEGYDGHEWSVTWKSVPVKNASSKAMKLRATAHTIPTNSRARFTKRVSSGPKYSTGTPSRWMVSSPASWRM